MNDNQDAQPNPITRMKMLFPGFGELTLEQKYRVILNSFALKEINREGAIKALLALEGED